MRFIVTSKQIDNMPQHSQEKCQLPQHTNMHAHTCVSHLETWGNGIDLRKQEKYTGQTWEENEHKLWGRSWCRKAFSLQFLCLLLYLFFLSWVCDLSWLLCICSPQSSLNHFRSHWKDAVHWPERAFRLSRSSFFDSCCTVFQSVFRTQYACRQDTACLTGH